MSGQTVASGRRQADKTGARTGQGPAGWTSLHLRAVMMADFLCGLAAGLLARGLHFAQTIDPGFQMKDITIASYGDIVFQALEAADALAAMGIEAE